MCAKDGVNEDIGAAAESIPQIVEVGPPGIEDKVYIRFRGAELTLPASTDVEAIAAVLRSLQQLC